MKQTVTYTFDGTKADVYPISEAKGACLGEAKVGKHRKHADVIGTVSGISYEKIDSFSGLFWKVAGFVPFDENSYIRVMRRRKFPIVLILIAVFLFSVVICMANPGWFTYHSGQKSATYIGEKGKDSGSDKTTSGKNANGNDYTSFKSVPDTLTWSASSFEQSIPLVNLEGNTVDLAPLIYVDLNHDGNFSDSECVYNADAAERLAPGHSVDKVTLTREIPAGTCPAEVKYLAFDGKKADGTDLQANGMNFDFNVNAQ